MATKKINIDFTGLTSLPPPLEYWGDQRFGIDSTMGHNALPCLKLWDTAANINARGEINVYHMENVVDPYEAYDSAWFYFPSNFTVGDWIGLLNPLFTHGGTPTHPSWAPTIEILLMKSGSDIIVCVGGEDALSNSTQTHWQGLLNKDGSLAWKTYLNYVGFPRGRWFNITWWMRKNPTLGESFCKFWFDGVLICDQTAFPYESGSLNYGKHWNPPVGDGAVRLLDFHYDTPWYITAFKLYHGTGESVAQQIWGDDLEVWAGNPNIVTPAPKTLVVKSNLPLTPIPYTIKRV